MTRTQVACGYDGDEHQRGHNPNRSCGNLPQDKLGPVAHQSPADAAVSAWHGSASDAHSGDFVTRARH